MYAVLTHRQTFHSGQLRKKVTCVSRSEGGRAAHEEGRVVANQLLISFLSLRRDLEQDNGHSSDLDQKEMVLYW